MNQSIDDLYAQIQENGISREFLTEIIAKGTTFPPLQRSMAFVVISGMKESDLKKFAPIALNCLAYAKNKDLPGLIAYLKGLGIPAPMVDILEQYGTNFIKE